MEQVPVFPNEKSTFAFESVIRYIIVRYQHMKIFIILIIVILPSHSSVRLDIVSI